MLDEGTIDRYEAKVFDAALRQQKTIERVPSRGFGPNRRNHVLLVNRDDRRAPLVTAPADRPCVR
jgi:hypothetical protein